MLDAKTVVVVRWVETQLDRLFGGRHAVGPVLAARLAERWPARPTADAIAALIRRAIRE